MKKLYQKLNDFAIILSLFCSATLVFMTVHEHYLMMALEQAWLGRGRCAPNPSVGAVAVKDGQVLASGWHAGPGRPHAEQVVLSALPPGLSNVTLYVTLEPCNHWGRTPPCVDAIVAYGIKQVVYGFSDLNPIVLQNKTPQLLAAQGIDVVFHPSLQVQHFYESYVHWVQTGRPWVSVKVAQSLDGKIADHHQHPCTLSNSACFQFTHQHRLYTDVILTTAKTILNDQPLLNVRLTEQPVPKTLAILDRTLKLPTTSPVFQTMRKAYVFYDQTLSKPSTHPAIDYVGVAAQGSHLCMETILAHLGKQGMHEVWVEAGSELFQTLHTRRLVQRTYLYVTPKVLGNAAYSLYQDETIFQQPHSVSWRVLEDNVVLTIDW